MNVRMWLHPATQRNVATARGRRRDASSGPTTARWPAANSARAAWPSRWRSSRRSRRCCDAAAPGPLAGKRVARHRRARRTSRSTRCATSPTARPASRATRSPRAGGARAREVTLVSGPVALADPPGVDVRRRRDARARCWRPSRPRCRPMSRSASPRSPTGAPPTAAGQQDQEGRRRGRRRSRWSRIPTSWRRSRSAERAARARRRLRRRDRGRGRPAAGQARQRKGCDWIVANDVVAATA